MAREKHILVSKTTYMDLHDEVKDVLKIDTKLCKMEIFAFVLKMFDVPIAPTIIDFDNNMKWFLSVHRETSLCINPSE